VKPQTTLALSRTLVNDTKSDRIRPHETALAGVEETRAETLHEICFQRDAPGFNAKALVGAVGIETTAAWHFNDLRSRARYEKEGLGSPWNPYCHLNAAFFPMMLRTTLRFASRTAFGIACV